MKTESCRSARIFDQRRVTFALQTKSALNVTDCSGRSAGIEKDFVTDSFSANADAGENVGLRQQSA